MKNFKKYFVLTILLFLCSITNQAQAGGGVSKSKPGSKSSESLMPLSPSYGDTLIQLEEGYYTLPADAQKIIPHYSKNSGNRKDTDIVIPIGILNTIDTLVFRLNRQLENPSLFQASHEIFVVKDELYDETLNHVVTFFRGMQAEAGAHAADGTLSFPNRLSRRLSTTFRYADFMSAIYRIMNLSELNAAQRLLILQTILTKLLSNKIPTYIFSPPHTDLILKLDPEKVDSVNTALVAEGSRIQNDVLLPGTMSILMKFSDKAQKKTEDLSILFFIR